MQENKSDKNDKWHSEKIVQKSEEEKRENKEYQRQQLDKEQKDNTKNDLNDRNQVKEEPIKQRYKDQYDNDKYARQIMTLKNEKHKYHQYDDFPRSVKSAQIPPKNKLTLNKIDHANYTNFNKTVQKKSFADPIESLTQSREKKLIQDEDKAEKIKEREIALKEKQMELKKQEQLGKYREREIEREREKQEREREREREREKERKIQTQTQIKELEQQIQTINLKAEKLSEKINKLFDNLKKIDKQKESQQFEIGLLEISISERWHKTITQQIGQNKKLILEFRKQLLKFG